MSKDDHLDKETSVSVEVTETGLKAGAKSRLVAAFDRFGGSLFDAASAHMEAHTEKKRAKTAGEVKLIETIAQYGVERLGVRPEEAERAFQRHFRKVLKEQENTDGVMRAALEDLRSNPPDETSANNDEPLSEEFLDRLEDYSATASTEDLRQRWGRVLAAEVRKPGTFSGKVLRVVDEIDSETALQFEEIAQHRIGQLLPRALIGKMNYGIRTNLVLAGLMVEPGLGGQVRFYNDAEESSGAKLRILGFQHIGAVSIPGEAVIKNNHDDDSALTLSDGKASMPCFVLTDAGEAVASILPDRQFQALSRYAQKLAENDALEWVRLYRPLEAGFQVIAQIPGKKKPPSDS